MPGHYFEEFAVGQMVRHALGRTITESDNLLFCGMTMNPQPLHVDAHYSAGTRWGKPLVNGLLTMGLAVGITVPELTQGTLVANLGYDKVRHPHPMFHGDTLYVESEVLEVRSSASQPDAGLVRFRHIGRNQHGEVVLDFERVALMLRRPES